MVSFPHNHLQAVHGTYAGEISTDVPRVLWYVAVTWRCFLHRYTLTHSPKWRTVRQTNLWGFIGS